MNHKDTEARRKELNELSARVIGCCIEVHRELGPGLLESVYEEALAFEFGLAGVSFQRQVERPVQYKGCSLNCGFRIDFVIEGKLILELKAAAALTPVHHAQLLTYLKLDRRPLGLLINFNVPVLRDGLRRVVCGETFKPERAGSEISALSALVLCASVSWWLVTGRMKI